MSTYALVQRGVVSITSADVGTSKNFALGTAIKPGSSFIVARVKDRRNNVAVQRGNLNIANPDASPKDTPAFTAVDLACSELRFSFRENRAGNARGVSGKLNSTTTARFQWYGAIAGGENVDVEYEVIEHKPRRGANIRVLDANNLVAEWDLQLLAGESIDIAYDVFDIENLGDDLKEILFQGQRLLGYQGEGKIQDLIIPDTPGNIVSYRSRVFNTKANAEAATIDLPAGSALETGELARYQVTVDIDKETNDRVSLISVRVDNLAATPGVS